MKFPFGAFFLPKIESKLYKQHQNFASHEAKLSTLEEEKADALEMAEKAHEEREEKKKVEQDIKFNF
ncbi:MAG TPA: hypothetical protein VJI46_03120 [Candidatus Nanoarchaeia archaeon]|nr:hypothetical protein [Candidatus Nanoarchaeia archaeon]